MTPAARLLPFLLLALLAARPATAQPADAVLEQAQALADRAADPSLAPHQRADLLQQRADIIARLIDQHPHDPRRAVWAADLAQTLLDTSPRLIPPLAAEDAADCALARRALAWIESAHRWAQETVSFLESEPSLTPAQADALDRIRSIELPARIPYLLGRAHLLAAWTCPQDETPAHADQAVRYFRSAGMGDPRDEAIRRLHLALALIRRDGPGDADQVRAVLQALGNDPDLTDQVLRAHLRIALATLDLRRAQPADAPAALRSLLRDEPFRAPQGADPALGLLAADALAAASARTQPDPTRALHAACAVYDALLDQASPADLAAFLPLLAQRLAPLLPQSPADDEPALALIARALPLARTQTTRLRAADLFEQAAARDHDLAPFALWEAVAIRLGAPNPDARALRSALLLADSLRRAGRTGDLASLLASALPHAHRLSESAPDDARDLYRRLLDLIDAAPALPDADYWRYERARLALQDDPASPAALDELQRLRGSPAVGDAADAALRAALTDAAQRAIAALDRARRSSDPRALQQALDQAVPVLRRADRVLDAPAITLALGEALADAGDPAAVDCFRSLLDSSAVDRARARLGLARALHNAGDDQAAFAQLRRLASELDAPPADPSLPPRPDAFWHAWALMLEILVQHPSPQRAQTIRAHAARLRTIDPALGGPPWAARIERVLARLEP